MDSKINILILGNEIVEQTLAWKIGKSPWLGTLYSLPADPAMSALCLCRDISPTDMPEVMRFIRTNKISLVIATGRVPVKEELLYHLETQNVKVIGLQRNSHSFATSRAALRSLAEGRGILMPTAHVFEHVDGAFSYCEGHRYPLVLKPDRMCELPSLVCHSAEEVEKSLPLLMQHSSNTGKVIVESYVPGDVIAVSALVSGIDIMTLPYCQLFRWRDRAAAACIPPRLPLEKLAPTVEQLILVPLVHALDRMISDFQGFLTLEISVGGRGYYLLNCRFHWTSLTAPLWISCLETDLVELLMAFSQNRLEDVRPRWSAAAASLLVWDTEDSQSRVRQAAQKLREGPVYLLQQTPPIVQRRSPLEIAVAVGDADPARCFEIIASSWAESGLADDVALHTSLEAAQDAYVPSKPKKKNRGGSDAVDLE